MLQSGVARHFGITVVAAREIAGAHMGAGKRICRSLAAEVGLDDFVSFLRAHAGQERRCRLSERSAYSGNGLLFGRRVHLYANHGIGLCKRGLACQFIPC